MKKHLLNGKYLYFLVFVFVISMVSLLEDWSVCPNEEKTVIRNVVVKSFFIACPFILEQKKISLEFRKLKVIIVAIGDG